jgi:hypothetical protein
MEYYIGLTDTDWYSFLRDKTGSLLMLSFGLFSIYNHCR